MTDDCDISSKISHRWTSLDHSDKPTLVQVMARCRQATSHYLSQCWPSSMSPNGVTRPQWVRVDELLAFSMVKDIYTSRFNEVERGVYWYHLVRLSVCPSVDRIVSALYLQQYSSDPFHICTSYQATSEGVLRVMPVSKFKNLKFFKFVTLTLSSFDLGSNMTQWYG